MNEWLSQQQGSVSKADIQKFLKENWVQIVEVVKGQEISDAQIKGEQEKFDKLNAEVNKLVNEYRRYRDWETDRKSTRLNSSHSGESRMPSSA